MNLKSRTVKGHSLCQFIHDLYITEIYRPGLAYLLVVDIIGLRHSPSGSPTILVFSHQTGCQYSDDDPPNGGVECKGYEKITIFDQNQFE